MSIPKYGLQPGRLVTVDGKPVATLNILVNPDNSERAIDPEAADALLKEMVARMNAFEASRPNAGLPTWRVEFKRNETVERRGYLDVRAETYGEAIEAARTLYRESDGAFNQTHVQNILERAIVQIRRWPAGVRAGYEVEHDIFDFEEDVSVKVGDPVGRLEGRPT